MIESDIQIDFSLAQSARRFDDSNHGLSHCMKAVDFIVELPDRILFVEVKDPQNPQARKPDIKNFISDLESGVLINDILKHKCRDSYLYELAMNNIYKPVYYFVLVGLDTLTTADLLQQSDLLRKNIPVDGPPGNPWPNKFIQGCMIMNMQSWNSTLTEFPVSRVSQQKKT